MKIPDHFRPFLIPAAWLATAALTFGLGRLTAFVEAPPEKSVATTASGGSHGAGAGMNFASGDAGWRVISASGAGGSAATLEELTGGKPLDEWLKHVLKQDDEIARMTGFMLLLDKLNTPAEIEEALKVVHASSRGDWGGRSTREASMLLQKWTKLDPKSAMAYAQGLDDPRSKFGGVNTVLQTWVRANPQEAVAWAKANGAKIAPDFGGGSDRPVGNWAMTSVLDQLAKTDLGQAIELAQAEPISMARGRIIETLVGQLVNQRGDAGAREAALAIADDSMRSAMIRQLAGRAAEADPVKALEWVATLPAGAAKSSALTETVRQWAQKDAATAAAYVKTLPIGPESDGPLASVARYVVAKDPAGAIALSNSIADPKARTQSLGEVVGSWMRGKDAEAAKQWVSQLPEETKTQIMAAAATNRDFGGRGFGGRGPQGSRGP